MVPTTSRLPVLHNRRALLSVLFRVQCGRPIHNVTKVLETVVEKGLYPYYGSASFSGQSARLIYKTTRRVRFIISRIDDIG